MRRFLFALLVFGLGQPGLAVATERLALVIAMPSFQGDGTSERAIDSAQAVAESLEAAGYDVDRVLDEPSATLSYAMTDFVLRLWQPDTIGILYFAGDGCQLDGKNYLLLQASDPATAATIADTSLPLDTLLRAIGGGTIVSALFLDVVPLGAPCAAGLAPVAPTFGSVTLSAAPGAIPVAPAGSVTIFAEALAAALRRPGATLDGVLQEITARVSAVTGGEQNPWTMNRLVAGIELVPLEMPTAGAPGHAEPLDGSPRGGGGGTTGDFSGGFDDLDAVARPGPGSGGSLSEEEEEALRQEYEARQAEMARQEEEARKREAEEQAAGAAEAERGSGEELENRGIVEALPGPAEAPADPPPPPPSPDGGVLALAEAIKPPSTGGAVLALAPVPPAPTPVMPADPVPIPAVAAATIARHPTLDAPDETVAGETVTVSIALTEEKITPEVSVEAGPGVTQDEQGALNLPLPAEQEEWPIDVDLFAPGFDLADGGEWSRRVKLFRAGDSDTVRFELKARRISGDAKPRQFMARFYHAGQFLGSATRAVTVYRSEEALEAAQAPSMAPSLLMTVQPSGDVALASGLEVADLDITIHYDDPDQLGPGLIVIHSPHISRPVTEEFDTPAGMAAWLDSRYRELVEAGMRVRGAEPIGGASAPDPASQKRFATRLAEGFGGELYEHYVPQSFKDVFWSLRAEGKLRSIQITSNSPLLPWEVVRPQAEDGTFGGFLGIDYRLARWTPRAPGRQVDRPLARLPFTGVATVAPAYEGNRELPFQQIEVAALSKLAGFRLVAGDFLSFERMVGEVSTGFIHFSGHGEVRDPGTGAPVFAIRLLDQALDPGTWQALDFAPQEDGNPFYFFNACDTGRARSLGGFVQGWGPAVLASGASGFIGGIWPLSDRTAASFSTSFYGEISDRLPAGPVYVAEVLQDVRRTFYATGDPTYLAYTFYGNANLQVVPQ